MSMFLTAAGSWLRRTPHSSAKAHESYSWLDGWRRWLDQRRQVAALREIADDKHLLSDLGLTRDEALSGHALRHQEEE